MDIDDIEQHAPNGPNFGLIVGIFCATLLIIFVLALFFVHFDGKHLTFRHRNGHPNSQLVLPASGRAAPVVTLA
jgi:hypothetical protein